MNTTGPRQPRVNLVVPQRKTPLACQHCRIKKIKCDGARPVCKPCSKRGWTATNCIYRHVEKKAPSASERLLEELRDRIQTLEQQRQVEDPSTLVTSAVPQISRPVESPDAPIRSIATTTTDPANAVGNPLVGGTTCEVDNEFLGPSSNTAFMNHIRQAIDGRTSESDHQGRQPHRAALRTATKSLNYVLPPRQLADSLLHSYWEFVHPLYPFLHEQSFHEIYETLWTGQALPTPECAVMRVDERTSVCILNLVLSLGCQYHREIESGDCYATADMFFRRSHALLLLDPIDSSNNSLQLVQAMMLMTQFLMGTGNTHKAWGIVGMAVRTCYQLGLHRAVNFGEHSLPRLIDREMIRRVYHGTLMLERLVCMNLGRPAMISPGIADPVSLPLEIDDNLVTTSGPRETGASIISFFVCSIKLYEIAQQILISFYSEANGQENDDYGQYFLRERSVFNFNNQLRNWRKMIPPHLLLQNYDGKPPSGLAQHAKFHRQAVVLWLRFLQVRIYLFRPIFALVCTSYTNCHVSGDKMFYERPDDLLEYRSGLQCAFLCAKTATELIDVMYENLTTSESWGKKPSWLYGVLHIYLAATVLLAARLNPGVTLGEISDGEIHGSWERAIQILENFQNDNASANRCVTVLRFLYQKLSGSGGFRTLDPSERHGPLNSTNPVLPGSSHAEEAPADTPEMRTGDINDTSGAVMPEMTQTFEWLDSFNNLDSVDMTWLNSVPGSLFSTIE